MTINEAMVLMKALRGRLAELSSLRSEVSTKTRYFGQAEKSVEPQYDVVVVDEYCVAIENALRRIDTAIKVSNAATHIDVVLDLDKLMAALPRP
jgi:ATP:corrinoid adenosyltransferase